MKEKPPAMALFMAAYYMTNSLYQSYTSLFYTDIGFSSGQIGAINAAVALASLAGQPLWGHFGDRTRHKRRLLGGLCLISGVVALSFLCFRKFQILLCLAGAFSFFYTAIQPLGDAIILQTLNAQQKPFGPLRLWGCAAFALSGLVYGRLINQSPYQSRIPLFTALLCALTALSTLALPKSPNAAQPGHTQSPIALFKHGTLMKLLAFTLPVQITMGYFYTFFSPHFMALPGANGNRLGLCYLISAISEMPFLLMADKLFDRLGAGKLMVSAALALSIRWLLLALTQSPAIAMFSQVFHGWGFIVITVSMAKFISQTVPKSLQASGQMLLAIATFGIARTVGNLGGGLLAEAIGRQNVFFVCTGMCLLPLILFAPGFLKSPPMNGLESPSA